MDHAQIEPALRTHADAAEQLHRDQQHDADAKNQIRQPHPDADIGDSDGDHDDQANGEARHLTVSYVSEGKEIRFTGGLGPMQSQGVAGALVWTVEPSGAGTKVTWTYTVGGYSDPPLDQIAPAVDRVETEQIASFKTYVEALR